MDEGEGGRMRGEGCGMGIALVGYCRTHHNCPCPRTWHHCPSYILVEKCLAPPLVGLRRYKLFVVYRPACCYVQVDLVCYAYWLLIGRTPLKLSHIVAD
jgi:hypothetical protein